MIFADNRVQFPSRSQVTNFIRTLVSNNQCTLDCITNCVSIQMRLIWLGSRGLIRVGCGWLRCVYLNATYIGPWIQRSHLSWISDIRVLRFSQKKDKAVTENWSKLNYQYTSRYADLFDKYCQVFSDSTGFLWSNFHGRNSQRFDQARGSLVANFLKGFVYRSRWIFELNAQS